MTVGADSGAIYWILDRLEFSRWLIAAIAIVRLKEDEATVFCLVRSHQQTVLAPFLDVRLHS